MFSVKLGFDSTHPEVTNIVGLYISRYFQVLALHRCPYLPSPTAAKITEPHTRQEKFSCSYHFLSCGTWLIVSPIHFHLPILPLSFLKIFNLYTNRIFLLFTQYDPILIPILHTFLHIIQLT